MQIEMPPELLLPFCQSQLDIEQLYKESKSYFKNRQYDKAAECMSEAIAIMERIGVEYYEYDKRKILYGHAGEAYAYNNDEDKSLDAFQKYQLTVSQIKSDDVSEGLLSFRRFNEYSLSDLINKEITLCHPRVMNDPFDTLLIKWGENLKKEKADKKHIKPLVDSFDYYRVRSFCRLKDSGGKDTIKNVLMWSHYANEHKGFCIRYKFDDDFIKTEEIFTTRFKQIIYKNKESVRKRKIINSDIALHTKHKAWKYENEVRLISYAPDESRDFIQIPLEGKAEIVSIYFGSRCDDRHIKTIREILKDTSVSFYKMVDNPSDIYNLDDEKISKDK